LTSSIITKTIFYLASVIIVIFIYSCAAIAPPSGGPEDKTPPEFLTSAPESGSTGFNGGEVRLQFSEYLDKKSVNTAISISPLTEPAVEIKYKDDEIHLNFPNSLMNDQTYIITVNRNLKDERNVPLDQSVQVAFSTGNTIEDGKIMGRVYGEDRYAVHLWKVDAELEDSLLLSKPLYISEADDNGFFQFNYLSAGNYATLAVERSAAGLPLVPNRIMYGTSPEKLYSLTFNAVIKNIPFMTHREIPKIKLTHVDWQGSKWGWIHFNQDLDNFNFEEMIIMDSDSKEQRPRYFQDNQDGSRLLLILDEALANGKVDLMIDKISLNGNSEIRNTKISFRASNKPDTTNIALLNPPPSSIINKDNKDGPIIPIIFSKPITSFSDSAFRMIADTDTVAINIDWNNPTEFSFVPPDGWKEKTDYRLMLFSGELTPIEGKSFIDSIKFLDFISKKKVGYGGLMGSVEPRNKSFLLQLKSITNNPEHFFSNVNSDNEFYLKNIPEGQYKLMMINDGDNNKAFTPGSVSPYKSSEWFYIFPDTFEVRANWDIDIGKMKIEDNN
jgi:hypothetical protein